MTTPMENKRELKVLLMQMKMDENYEMRVLAEETIVNMFDQDTKALEMKDALIQELTAKVNKRTQEKYDAQARIKELEEKLNREVERSDSFRSRLDAMYARFGSEGV